MEAYSTALQGGPGAAWWQRPACCIQKEVMSDIPPNPPKSPIVIIGLLALAGAVVAGIGYLLANW